MIQFYINKKCSSLINLSTFTFCHFYGGMKKAVIGAAIGYVIKNVSSDVQTLISSDSRTRYLTIGHITLRIASTVGIDQSENNILSIN